VSVCFSGANVGLGFLSLVFLFLLFLRLCFFGFRVSKGWLISVFWVCLLRCFGLLVLVYAPFSTFFIDSAGLGGREGVV
jgi:hypothetical protein